ncbi:unnamed protein product [Phytomonas sp. Hart1]|nr:unnamed protein product [Phytomonas sp. Hart1]|eukprot:CCW65957.1 unnamed protein product [Phytomonas sp. isolate Hart1]
MASTAFTVRVPSRVLLRIRGAEAHDLLQGLFTNDLRELRPGGSLWGCFLFFTGRVMCDAYLYQSRHLHLGQASILVEIHRGCRDHLLEHLREMRLRKKVQIDDVSNELSVFASFGPEDGRGEDLRGGISPDPTAGKDGLDSFTLLEANAERFDDPRQFALSSGENSASSSFGLIKTIISESWAPRTTLCGDVYTQLLLSNGIGEGPEVFKFNKTFPFEANVDFLHGVSFHKGCYLGQELTHRTHVMLVTRKRNVPLVFPTVKDSPLSSSLEDGLYSSEKEKVGEITTVSGGYGLGLIRMKYVDKERKIIPGLSLKDGTPVEMSIPSWWPQKEVKKMLKGN